MSETRTVRLGDVCQVVSGATPKTSVEEYWDGDINWVTPADLSKLSGAYISETPRKITEAGFNSCGTNLLPENSVLLSSRAPIGHVAINTVPMATNQGFKSLIPGDQILPKFLYYWLIDHKEYLQSLGVGATFKELSKKTVENIKLDLPPLEEQAKQVEIRDLQSMIAQKRERQQELYTELERSLFISIFGNPETWANKFEMTTIGDLAESTQYGTSAKAGATGEYPVLRMGNITDDGKLDLSNLKYMDLSPEEVEKYTVRKGDLLFNRTNSKEKVGKAAVMLTDEKLAYAGYLVRVRFKNPDHAHFVAAFLNSDYGRKLRRKLAKNAVNQANINAKELTKIPIIEPENKKIINFNNFFTL